jgi:hypothetical protein
MPAVSGLGKGKTDRWLLQQMLEAVLPSAAGDIKSFPETLALLLLYLVKADASGSDNRRY